MTTPVRAPEDGLVERECRFAGRTIRNEPYAYDSGFRFVGFIIPDEGSLTEQGDDLRALLLAKADDARRIGELEAAGKRMQEAEAAYRLTHDTYGDGHIFTGRVWDAMRRAGDALRAALNNGGGRGE